MYIIAPKKHRERERERERARKAAGGKGGSEMEVVDKQQLDHNNSKAKEEQHLSGAYIRSLVKQLTSSRTKVSQRDHYPDTGTHVVDDGDGDGFPCIHQNLTKFGEGRQQQQRAVQQQQQHQQQNKKQIRRRLHTSRPYQERLLNMAEARREIVTALKFHRAAMKQAANEQQQQQQKPPSPSPSQQQQQQEPTQLLQPHHDHQQSLLSLHQEGNINSRRNPKICQSSNNFSNCLNNNNNNNNISSSYSNLCSSSSPNPYFSWPHPASQIAPPDISSENLNSLALPNQTLGLNLNFGDFNNLDANLYHNNSPPSTYSSSLSPPSSSSSPSPNIHNNSIVTHDHPATSVTILQQGTQPPPAMVVVGDINVAEYYSSSSSTSMMNSTGSGEGLGLGLHPVMDDEEMEEIRSIGEQHQMEWNDTLNLVTSAWWFKFLNTTKIGPREEEEEEENKSDHHPFDQAMEFPSWLNLNDTSLLHQHYYLDRHCLDDDYSQDPALPCMEIGKIEGMDGEWLA